MKLKLLVGSLVAGGSIVLAGTASSALTNGGASSADTNDFTHVNYITPQASMTAHRGSVIPLNVNFGSGANSIPGIWFGYEDSSGQHYSVQVNYDDLSGKFSLKVPSNMPNGTIKLETIEVYGTGQAAHQGEQEFSVTARNQEFVALPMETGTPTNGYQPRERKYNVDFTKLDLKIS